MSVLSVIHAQDLGGYTEQKKSRFLLQGQIRRAQGNLNDALHHHRRNLSTRVKLEDDPVRNAASYYAVGDLMYRTGNYSQREEAI